LLRPREHWPACTEGSDQRDEIAPLHVRPKRLKAASYRLLSKTSGVNAPQQTAKLFDHLVGAAE
jgi:hypothetical protein